MSQCVSINQPINYFRPFNFEENDQPDVSEKPHDLLEIYIKAAASLLQEVCIPNVETSWGRRIERGVKRILPMKVADLLQPLEIWLKVH